MAKLRGISSTGGGGGAVVVAPSPTNEDVSTGGTPSGKTFSAFTDTDSLIDNYNAVISNLVGSSGVSGSGLGPYSFSSYSDGDSFVLFLQARNSSNEVLASAAHTVSVDPADAIVSSAAPTNEDVSSGGSPSSKTFSAFTDSDNRIDNYNAIILNLVGSTAIAGGSGLGAYTFSGHADGDSFALVLQARNTGNEVLSVSVHTVSIAAASGGGALDPDDDTQSINTTNVSNATSGWGAGSIDFRGPTDSSGATLGGSDAASFSLSGGSDGTVSIAAATNLSAGGGSGAGGEYEFNLSVDNEGGLGYTTSTVQVVITPDTSTLLMIVSDDGYVYYRHAGGSWEVDLVWSGQNLLDIDISEDTDNFLVMLCRFDQTTNADTLQSTDIVTPTWNGNTNIGGTSYAAQTTYVDDVNGYVLFGHNNGRGTYKAIADVLTDGNFSSFSTMRFNSGGDWSGNNYSIPDDYISFASGRIVVCGWHWNSGNGQPHLSTCDGAPSGTWTERVLGGWTQGFPRKMCTDGTTLVCVGSSSTWGVMGFSSNEGTTWDTTVAYASTNFYGVACKPDGSLWVAVGVSGVIYTTTDPTSVAWTSRTSGTSETLNQVQWDAGAGEFVAVGTNTECIASTDGITWAAETLPAGSSGALQDIRARTTAAPA